MGWQKLIQENNCEALVPAVGCSGVDVKAE